MWIIKVAEWLSSVFGWVSKTSRLIEKLVRDYEKIRGEVDKIKEDNRNLESRVKFLEKQFDRFDRHIKDIDQALETAKNRIVMNAERSMVKNAEIEMEFQRTHLRQRAEIEKTLLKMDGRLDTMLADIRESRQALSNRSNDPSIEHLLALLANTSNQIGGKRRSLKAILGKLGTNNGGDPNQE